MDVKEYALK
jgi:hypothetical protein